MQDLRMLPRACVYADEAQHEYSGRGGEMILLPWHLKGTNQMDDWKTIRQSVMWFFELSGPMLTYGRR